MTNDFEALTADELYLLHLELTAVLRKKLVTEKNRLRSDYGNSSHLTIARLRSRTHAGPIQR